MSKLLAFFVFDGTEFFKSLSISSLENSENLLCNAIFSKTFQLPLTSSSLVRLPVYHILRFFYIIS